MMCVRNDKVVRLLLQAGAYADLRDRGGETALMLAANLGGDLNSARGVSAVRLLLSVGRASVDLQDDQGRTALIWAASHAAPLLVHLLLAAGASKDVQDRRGRTALMASILGHNTSAVGQMLAAGASTTLQDHGGGRHCFMPWSGRKGSRIGLTARISCLRCWQHLRQGQPPWQASSQKRARRCYSRLLGWAATERLNVC